MHIPAARVVIPAEDEEWILAQIRSILRSGRLTLGDYTAQFEAACAAVHEVKYAVAVSSGTAALEIIIRALGMESTDIIVPTNTFFATAAAVLRAGARPRFADIDSATFALSWETVEPLLTPQTSGVILVHVGGLVSPAAPQIARQCAQRGLRLIEDAAHAHGSSLNGHPAGTFGIAAALSFYPTKVITSGEGGMILTDDADLAAEARIFRDQGKAGFDANYHVRLGSNYRLSEIHAAIGLAQLRRLREFASQRARIAERYTDRLQGHPLLQPIRPARGSVCNFYKYIVLLADGLPRDVIKRRLREPFGVELSGEVYAVPLHRQPVFAVYAVGALPVAERVCRQHVCLPIYATMTEDEANYVLTSLEAVVQEATVSSGGER